MTDEIMEEEQKRDTANVTLREVLNIVKGTFEFYHKQLVGRTETDQRIIGDFLTSIELELKKDLKGLDKNNLK